MPNPNGVWTSAECDAYYEQCTALMKEREAMHNMLKVIQFMQHEIEVHHDAIRDARPERGGPFADKKLQRAEQKMLAYAAEYHRRIHIAAAAVWEERWNLDSPVHETVNEDNEDDDESKATSDSSDKSSQDDVDFAAASDSDSDSDDGVVENEDEDEDDTPPPPPAREPRHARAPRRPRPIRQFAHAYNKAGRKRRYRD